MQKERDAVFDTYAIFQTGGKQYQAIKGQTIAIEKIDQEAGSSLTFDNVLMKKSGDEVEIGQPYIDSPIKASIVKQTRGPKLIAFKFKRRKKYRRKIGHRQPVTVVRIDEI